MIEIVKKIGKCPWHDEGHEFRLLSLVQNGYLQESQKIAKFYCIYCLQIIEENI